MKASDHPCAICPLRARAERAPNSLTGRLWNWHITWCPGWKSYQSALASEAKAKID